MHWDRNIRLLFFSKMAHNTIRWVRAILYYIILYLTQQKAHHKALICGSVQLWAKTSFLTLAWYSELCSAYINCVSYVSGCPSYHTLGKQHFLIPSFRRSYIPPHLCLKCFLISSIILLFRWSPQQGRFMKTWMRSSITKHITGWGRLRADTGQKTWTRELWFGVFSSP